MLTCFHENAMVEKLALPCLGFELRRAKVIARLLDAHDVLGIETAAVIATKARRNLAFVLRLVAEELHHRRRRVLGRVSTVLALDVGLVTDGSTTLSGRG